MWTLTDEQMATILEPADLVLVHSAGWIPGAIRVLTTDKGESKTEVNHVELVVRAGSVRDCTVIGATWPRVRRAFLDDALHDGASFTVARSLDITPDRVKLIVAHALAFEGRVYGLHNLALHALHLERWCSARIPVCSSLAALSYAWAGLRFGVEAKSADPDDIWDYTQAHPTKYWFPLSRDLVSLPK